MKFFTEQLINKMYSVTEDEEESFAQEWRQVVKEYFEYLDSFKHRMPKNFLQIYQKNKNFHDFNLVGIQIKRNDKTKKIPFIDVIITITNTRNIYDIKYLYVNSFSMNGIFDFSEGEWIKTRTDRMDVYLYDEFNAVSDSILSHEILFLSGSTIKINFKKISISKIK